MTIKCDQCGYENHENYRFCGMCGAMLHTPKAAESEPIRPVAPPPSAPSVSGPSFLGLDTERPKDDVTYLLEDDEPSSGRGRMIVALVLLVIAGGLLAWRWRAQGYAWWQKETASAPVMSAPVASSSTGTPPVGGGVSTGPSPSEPLASTNQAKPSQGPPPPLPSADEAHTTSNEAAQTSPKSPAPQKPLEAAKKAPPANPEESAGAETEASDQDATPASDMAATKPTETSPVTKASASTATQDKLVSDGEKYLYGNGVPEDCNRAKRSLNKAADQSSAKAMSMLGTMYATGHCVNLDLPNAYRWFAKAMHQDPGNQRLQQNLEVLWRQMSPAERQIAMRNQ